METKTRSIRVYKVEYADTQQVAFVWEDGEGRGSVGLGTVWYLVESLKREVYNCLHSGVTAPSKVTVVFCPPYDLEFSLGVVPRRCLPLSQEEQDRFWDLYADDARGHRGLEEG